MGIMAIPITIPSQVHTIVVLANEILGASNGTLGMPTEFQTIPFSARDLIEAELRPWENKQRKYSPQQVRRGLAKILPQLGSPAIPPQTRGKSKGRSAGVTFAKRTRFPVIRKKPSLPQLVST